MDNHQQRLRMIQEGFANCDRRVERAKASLRDSYEAYGFWEQALAKLQQDTGIEYDPVSNVDIRVSDAVPMGTMLVLTRDGDKRLVARNFVFADPEQEEL